MLIPATYARNVCLNVCSVIILVTVLIVLRGCMFRLLLCVLSVCILVFLVILPRIVIRVWKGFIVVRQEYAPTVLGVVYLVIVLLGVCHVILGFIWMLVLMFVKSVRWFLRIVGSVRILLVYLVRFSIILILGPVLSVVR